MATNRYLDIVFLPNTNIEFENYDDFLILATFEDGLVEDVLREILALVDPAALLHLSLTSTSFYSRLRPRIISFHLSLSEYIYYIAGFSSPSSCEWALSIDPPWLSAFEDIDQYAQFAVERGNYDLVTTLFDPDNRRGLKETYPLLAEKLETVSQGLRSNSPGGGNLLDYYLKERAVSLARGRDLRIYKHFLENSLFQEKSKESSPIFNGRYFPVFAASFATADTGIIQWAFDKFVFPSTSGNQFPARRHLEKTITALSYMPYEDAMRFRDFLFDLYKQSKTFDVTNFENDISAFTTDLFRCALMRNHDLSKRLIEDYRDDLLPHPVVSSEFLFRNSLYCCNPDLVRLFMSLYPQPHRWICPNWTFLTPALTSMKQRFEETSFLIEMRRRGPAALEGELTKLRTFVLFLKDEYSSPRTVERAVKLVMASSSLRNPAIKVFAEVCSLQKRALTTALTFSTPHHVNSTLFQNYSFLDNSISGIINLELTADAMAKEMRAKGLANLFSSFLELTLTHSAQPTLSSLEIMAFLGLERKTLLLRNNNRNFILERIESCLSLEASGKFITQDSVISLLRFCYAPFRAKRDAYEYEFNNAHYVATIYKKQFVAPAVPSRANVRFQELLGFFFREPILKMVQKYIFERKPNLLKKTEGSRIGGVLFECPSLECAAFLLLSGYNFTRRFFDRLRRECGKKSWNPMKKVLKQILQLLENWTPEEKEEERRSEYTRGKSLLAAARAVAGVLH